MNSLTILFLILNKGVFSSLRFGVIIKVGYLPERGWWDGDSHLSDSCEFINWSYTPFNRILFAKR